MRFTLVRQTNLTQKGRQENRIYFCMHVIYIYIPIQNYICIYVIPTHMYIVYMREVFWCPTLTLRPKTKNMYNYHIQYVCITLQCQLYLHMKINITYVNIYWSTWPKAHSKNQTQINCNWTQINCNSLVMARVIPVISTNKTPFIECIINIMPLK